MHTGSKILYFGYKNLLLLQFRCGSKDCRNLSTRCRDNKKLTLRFWSNFWLPCEVYSFTKIELFYLKVVLTRRRFMIFKITVEARL